MGDVVNEVELDYFFSRGEKKCNSVKHLEMWTQYSGFYSDLCFKCRLVWKKKKKGF